MRFSPDSLISVSTSSAHELHCDLFAAADARSSRGLTFCVDLEIPNFQNGAESAPQDVIACVDVSGSMTGAMADVQRVVCLLARQLRPADCLAVVTFQSAAHVVFPLGTVSDLDAFDALIQRSLRGGGGTDIGCGVALCLDEFARAGASAIGRVSSLIVLSDGQTTGLSADGIVALCHSRLADCGRQLIVNSLGFTTSCDVPLMQAITRGGNAGSGLFYFLRSSDPADIGSAIGDCLGSTASIALTDLQLDIVPAGDARFAFYRGGGGDGESRARLGAMSVTQRHTFVVTTCASADAPMPPAVDLVLTYSPVGAQHLITHRISVPLVSTDDVNLTLASEAHCVTHVLRERVAALLHRLCAAPDTSEARNALVEELADVQETIIAKLQALQASELSAYFARMDAGGGDNKPRKKKGGDGGDAADDAASTLAALAAAMALHDEAVLEALSVDVGQVLVEQVAARHHRRATAFAGNVLRAMHEHMHQRSAHNSSGELRAGVYTTRAQLAMRMRFVEGDAAATAAAKAAVPLESAELYGSSDEALALRRAVDEEVQCFVSLENWREAHLGLALVVQPRTGRERRRGLLPRAILSGDVISSSTYNEGVRTLVQAAPLVQLDRDDVEHAEQHSVVVSSSRGRINAWLPLYINAEHWKHVRRYAPASVSIIATQFNDQFSPALCLGVMAKLLIQTVVRFTVENDVSERTLQQFCDVHRVFLQLADDHPEVRQLASARLARFVAEPAARMRAETSDLGDLIQYLCIVEEQQWAGALADAFVVESVRRAALQMGAEAHRLVHRLDGDVDKLLEFWAEHTSGGKVTTFCVAFLELLARPAGATLEALKADIDRRWGHVRPSALAQLRDVCATIARGERTVPQIMSNLVGRQVTPGAAAELILWGFREAFADEERRVARFIALPSDEGDAVAEWRERCRVWRAALQTPAPELDPIGDEKAPRKRMLAGVGRTIKREAKLRRHTALQAPACAVSVHAVERHTQLCDCKRCQYSAFIAAAVARWNGAEHARDDDAAKMFVGGLAASVTEAALLDLLVKYGRVRVLSLEVVRDKANPAAHRRYAFAFYDSEEAMLLAMRNLRAAWVEERVGVASGSDDDDEAVQARDSTIDNPFPALEAAAEAAEATRRRRRTWQSYRFWLEHKPVVFDRVRRVEPRWHRVKATSVVINEAQ
jgi:hypothetical protein